LEPSLGLVRVGNDVSRASRKLSTSEDEIEDWFIGIRRGERGNVDDGSGVGLFTETEGDCELTRGDRSCNREKS
jgi:hypothetical protein